MTVGVVEFTAIALLCNVLCREGVQCNVVYLQGFSMRVGIVNRKVARRVRAGQTLPLMWCLYIGRVCAHPPVCVPSSSTMRFCCLVPPHIARSAPRTARCLTADIAPRTRRLLLQAMEGTILVTGPQRWTAPAQDGVRVRAHLRALLWACAAAALIAGCAVLWQTAGDTHYGRAHVHFPAPATTRRWPVAIHRAAALRWAPVTQADGNGGARTAATNAVSDPRLLSAARQTGVRTAPAEAPGPLSVPRGEAAHAAVPPPPCAAAACAPPPPAAPSIPWRWRAFLAACGVFAVLSAVIRCRRVALGVAMAAATGETEPPPEGASAARDETGNAVGGVALALHLLSEQHFHHLRTMYVEHVPQWIEAAVQRKESCLLILVGAPGAGKSTFGRHLHGHVRQCAVTTVSNDLQEGLYTLDRDGREVVYAPTATSGRFDFPLFKRLALDPAKKQFEELMQKSRDSPQVPIAALPPTHTHTPLSSLFTSASSCDGCCNVAALGGC